MSILTQNLNMKTLKTVILLIFILGCKSTKIQKNKPNTDIGLNGLPKKVMSKEIKIRLESEQKQILSALTGISKINQNSILEGRWDEKSKIAVRGYLSDLIKNIGLNPKEHNYKIDLIQNEKLKHYEGTNLYAIIPAKKTSDEYIILGAHYDSVIGSPGANDNATGCALIYGVASLLTKTDVLNKNLILIFFDQEELGLVGSQAFTSFIKENKYNIHSVHTVDQMGWDEDEDNNIEIELPTPQLKAIYQKHATYFGISAYVTTETGSDHQAFRKAGFNAIGITEEYNNNDTTPHYHKSTDTYNTVNFDYLASTTLFVYKVIEELAGI